MAELWSPGVRRRTFDFVVRPEVLPGPINAGYEVRVLTDYCNALFFLTDNNTISISVAVLLDDKPLHALRYDAAFTAAVQAFPLLAPWISRDAAEPIFGWECRWRSPTRTKQRMSYPLNPTRTRSRPAQWPRPAMNSWRPGTPIQSAMTGREPCDGEQRFAGCEARELPRPDQALHATSSCRPSLELPADEPRLSGTPAAWTATWHALHNRRALAVKTTARVLSEHSR